MKRILLPGLYVMLLSFIHNNAFAQANEAAYDSTLANRLGGDRNGMKMFHLVLLTNGPRTDLSKAVQDSLLAGHMANIHRLSSDGSLSLAGPFGKNDRYGGLFIFNTTSMEEAERLVNTDPAVAGGMLGYEIYPWYGSAAVNEIPHIHKRISKDRPTP